MEYVAIVTTLALVQAFYFGVKVGLQREAHGIVAPAISGHPDFDRAFRVQQNTIEQLIVVVPSLWIFATYWSPGIAAGLGLIFVIGRQIYSSAYMGDPSKRTIGFGIGALATVILLIGSLVGAIMNLL